jgi:hypothetical protein
MFCIQIIMPIKVLLAGVNHDLCLSFNQIKIGKLTK